MPRLQVDTAVACAQKSRHSDACGNQLTQQWRLRQLLDRAAGVAGADAVKELDCSVAQYGVSAAICTFSKTPGFRSTTRSRPMGRGASGRYTIPEDFDVNEYLKEAWGILRGGPVTVK